MKTKKLLVITNFVNSYRELVRNAFRWYVAFIEYDLSLVGNTKGQKDEFALRAMYFATRANAVWDSAFYTEITGLASALTDIQNRECECYGCLDTDTTMDDIVDWVWDYINDSMSDIDE